MLDRKLHVVYQPLSNTEKGKLFSDLKLEELNYLFILYVGFVVVGLVQAEAETVLKQ